MLVNKLKDRWLRIIAVPLFSILSTVIFYSDEWLIHNQSFAKCIGSAFLNTLILWYLNRYIVILLRAYFPSIKQTFSRVWRQLIFSTILSLIASLVITKFYDSINFWGRSATWNDYLYNIVVVLFFVYVAITIYELNFYFREWQNSLTETEQLKKANLQSQFDALKNQVSPHFLFNSLNTLSSLIEDDPNKAILFVNQLSLVYRYLLQSNEKELSTLFDELAFLKAYFFLLKTRFEDGISMQIEIDEKYMQFLIPPLTLQILVENAVKHNIISVSKPLLIKVTTEGENTLLVKNNLQKKTLNVISNGLGLANIAAKYKLLNKSGLEIVENTDDFIVSLPLLTN
jgi:sensor histidine kinase YesM